MQGESAWSSPCSTGKHTNWKGGNQHKPNRCSEMQGERKAKHRVIRLGAFTRQRNMKVHSRPHGDRRVICPCLFSLRHSVSSVESWTYFCTFGTGRDRCPTASRTGEHWR